MNSSARPWWQQATALVSLGMGGTVAGLHFVPGSVADVTAPAAMPVHLLALRQLGRPAPAADAALRAAVVNVAGYYLQLAAHRTPAEMAALIWQQDSVNGVDHGASSAAFASLTLELAAQAVGQQSWVTGGGSYPWPLQRWADVRVAPNPASPGVVSVIGDAEAHDRWHPLGDGYEPRPGDWVVFHGDVEVVTRYSGGVLHTIGGDSLPNFSVNAHEYPGPLSSQGVTGFVNNGTVPAVRGGGAAALVPAPRSPGSPSQSGLGLAAIPGLPAAAVPVATASQPDVPGAGAPVPGHQGAASRSHTAPDHRAAPAGPYRRHRQPRHLAPVHDTESQQAFIRAVAPGAEEAQRRYGVPAAVTIAQAIDESGWGQSTLATRDHNLFGIKGTGPAGSDQEPTSEYEDGHWLSIMAPFRVYHDVAESIDDHGRLLATSGYYGQAMAVRGDPDAFARALTGVYATDPTYGTQLVGLMQRYDLYRYDTSAQVRSHAVVDHRTEAPDVSRATRRQRSPGASPSAKTSRYQQHLPASVHTAVMTTALTALRREEPLYRDVASHHAGLRWELLAACDWMQCKARARYSPVYGERLGTVNPAGTVYRTKSEALEQCADDLVELARTVYGIDVTTPGALSVREVASVFAAFRWGGLLKQHRTSAMEFPYSVAGLTVRHVDMRWPNIDDPHTPDKPGGRFHMPFGAVPIVLCLDYPATV